MKFQRLIIINEASITEKRSKEERLLNLFSVALRDIYVSHAFLAVSQFTHLFFLCTLNCTSISSVRWYSVRHRAIEGLVLRKKGGAYGVGFRGHKGPYNL
jgi:hypothetical protein